MISISPQSSNVQDLAIIINLALQILFYEDNKNILKNNR